MQDRANGGTEPTIRAVTVRGRQIYYVPVAKAGCTFLKNLFFYLDHGRVLENPHSVHDSQELRRSKVTRKMVSEGAVLLAAVNRPAARLVSLYFDKVWSTGPTSFKWLREGLIKRRNLQVDPALDLQGHRDNVLKLLRYIRRDIRLNRPSDVNPHWREQAFRLNAARDVGATILPLTSVDALLPELLRPHSPQIDEAMTIVSDFARNRTSKPYSTGQLINRELEELIDNTYERDQRIFETAEAAVKGPVSHGPA